MRKAAWSRVVFYFFPDSKMIEILTRAEDSFFTLIGTESLNNSQMKVFQCRWDIKKRGGDSGVIKTWVGVTDGFPYQMELEGQIDGQNLKATSTFSDYNSDISIRAPATFSLPSGSV